MKRTRIAITLAIVVLSLTQMMCGCLPTPVTTNVFTYQDLNSNGTYDPGESGFPNVMVTYAGGTVPTDGTGHRVLKMDVSIAGCETNSPITASVPAGYTLSESVAPIFDCNSLSPFTYTELQRDVVFGFAPLPPTPTAGGTPGAPTQAASTPTAAAAETPGLSITKLSMNPTNYTSANQKISISYTFTNTGNVELNGKFDVSDQLADAGTITCTQDPAATDLMPQQSVTCTAAHMTTDADVAEGVGGHPVYEKVTVTTTYKGVTVQASGDGGIGYETPAPKEAQSTQPAVSTPSTKAAPTATAFQ